jgi:hypothetical protein
LFINTVVGQEEYFDLPKYKIIKETRWGPITALFFLRSI